MRRATLLLVLAAAGPLSAPASCSAEAASATTLVIERAPGVVDRLCVEAAEGSTALDVLQRAGLAVRYQDYGGGNAFVCSIDGVGCDYPADPCACRYEGTRTFWGLYLVRDGGWTFAQTGAAATMVRPGDVVGWRWGAHDGQDDPPSSRPRAGKCRTVAASANTSARGASPVPLFALGITVAVLLALALVLRARRVEAGT